MSDAKFHGWKMTENVFFIVNNCKWTLRWQNAVEKNDLGKENKIYQIEVYLFYKLRISSRKKPSPNCLLIIEKSFYLCSSQISGREKLLYSQYFYTIAERRSGYISGERQVYLSCKQKVGSDSLDRNFGMLGYSFWSGNHGEEWDNFGMPNTFACIFGIKIRFNGYLSAFPSKITRLISEHKN